ncbi:7817_t:CDS:10 [Ambispora gerdemannii]|uniref:7817_t:CDS:1 n=1 Tax=Ambispora gerdemannii TaxID=144530 RepID=A0A9N8VV25_9GLOM|nr:7817_t:CDS:10 [Ambispora gerdemannii]
MSLVQNALRRNGRNGQPPTPRNHNLVEQEEIAPFIPITFISAPTQRLCALSFYILIWSIKLYHIFIDNESFTWTLIVCCFVDVVYFVILWSLQIPWLQFRFWTLIFSIVTSCLLDLTLLYPRWPIDVGLTAPVTNFSSWTSTFIRQQYAKLWVNKVRAVSSEDTVKINEIRYNTSHIKGKHTVRYLPYATAKLNPDDLKLCLHRKKQQPSKKTVGSSVNLPVLFNNTIPKTIEYSRIDTETGEKVLLNFTKRDIEKHRVVDKAMNIAFVYIPVQIPGVYRLEQAWDWHWMNIKIYRKEEIIAYCPDAKFSSKVGQHRCLNDEIPVDLILQGIPPFSVYYERIVGGIAVNMTIDGVASENTIVPGSRSDQISGYQWARDRIIEVPLVLTTDIPAQYSLKILRIRDALNNTHIYEKEENAQSYIEFTVHSRPSVSFLSDATIKIKPADSPNIALELKGQEPWRIHIGYWAEDIAQDNNLAMNTSDIIEYVLERSTDDMINVKKPGLYKLLSVLDAFCSGQVLAPSNIIVLEVLPPSVILDTIPISTGDCPGEVGLEVIMTLTGSPPWMLEYSIVHQGQERTIPVQIFKARHSFAIMPETSGQHDYKFKRLSDYYYRDGLEIGRTISQVVHPKPDATLRSLPGGGNQINTCVGSRVDLDVRLVGIEPFTLTYDVLYNQRKNAFTIGDIQGPYHTIMSPPFENPGTYTVTLEKIVDAKGCSRILDSSNDVIVNVMKERPTVGFRTTNEVLTFLEGDDIDLPLQLTGNPPWEITYRYHDKIDKNVSAVQLRDPNSHLTVNLPGRYELLEVKDLYCYGKVIPELKYIVVAWIPRPNMKIVEGEAIQISQDYYQRKHVCEKTEDGISVTLQGRAPWVVNYNIQAEENYLQKQEIIGGYLTRIPLLTDTPGKYRYEFYEIADDAYIKLHPMSLTLEQTVIKNPNARFSHSIGTINHCVGHSLTEDDTPLIVELEGVAPFTVLFEIKHQSSNMVETLTIDDIYEKKYKFRPRTKFSMVGKYTITILHIIDSQNCSRIPEGPDKQVLINVSDVASIERLFPQEIHCVGDLLIYSLQGISPYYITYTYNGETKHAMSKSSEFTFGADKPGNMTITKVCHQNDMCCGYPTDFSEVIYDLPTAIVSEGKDIISDIREGDKTEIIIEFIGIPPFRFTYTRSEILPDGKRGKAGHVLETQTVLNVRENKYSIFTAQEGIFQVTYIADKYCEYPRVASKHG